MSQNTPQSKKQESLINKGNGFLTEISERKAAAANVEKQIFDAQKKLERLRAFGLQIGIDNSNVLARQTSKIEALEADLASKRAEGLSVLGTLKNKGREIFAKTAKTDWMGLVNRAKGFGAAAVLTALNMFGNPAMAENTHPVQVADNQTKVEQTQTNIPELNNVQDARNLKNVKPGTVVKINGQLVKIVGDGKSVDMVDSYQRVIKQQQSAPVIQSAEDLDAIGVTSGTVVRYNGREVKIVGGGNGQVDSDTTFIQIKKRFPKREVGTAPVQGTNIPDQTNVTGKPVSPQNGETSSVPARKPTGWDGVVNTGNNFLGRLRQFITPPPPKGTKVEINNPEDNNSRTGQNTSKSPIVPGAIEIEVPKPRNNIPSTIPVPKPANPIFPTTPLRSPAIGAPVKNPEKNPEPVLIPVPTPGVGNQNNIKKTPQIFDPESNQPERNQDTSIGTPADRGNLSPNIKPIPQTSPNPTTVPNKPNTGVTQGPEIVQPKPNADPSIPPVENKPITPQSDAVRELQRGGPIKAEANLRNILSPGVNLDNAIPKGYQSEPVDDTPYLNISAGANANNGVVIKVNVSKKF